MVHIVSRGVLSGGDTWPETSLSERSLTLKAYLIPPPPRTTRDCLAEGMTTVQLYCAPVTGDLSRVSQQH